MERGEINKFLTSIDDSRCCGDGINLVYFIEFAQSISRPEKPGVINVWGHKPDNYSVQCMHS